MDLQAAERVHVFIKSGKGISNTHRIMTLPSETVAFDHDIVGR